MYCVSDSAFCRQNCHVDDTRQNGPTENARPDIARLDNARPYSKGGHRETCFSVRVDAHCKFMFVAGSIRLYKLLIGFMFLFYFFLFSFFVYVRQTKLASSLVNVSAYYKIRITMIISARQTERSPSITHTRIAHASQYRACPQGTSAKPARGATRNTSQQSSEVLAAAAVADSYAPEVVAPGTGACLSSSSSSLLLLLLCRPAAVGTPYERRQNGWLHAETAGNCKRRCWIVTNRI